jgi:hypothetical protein
MPPNDGNGWARSGTFRHTPLAAVAAALCAQEQAGQHPPPLRPAIEEPCSSGSVSLPHCPAAAFIRPVGHREGESLLHSPPGPPSRHAVALQEALMAKTTEGATFSYCVRLRKLKLFSPFRFVPSPPFIKLVHIFLRVVNFYSSRAHARRKPIFIVRSKY